MNDADIRPILWGFLKEKFPGGWWIEEFNFGNSRADFVVFDEGEILGFEIKGENDSLVRLNTQIGDYDTVASRNYAVVVDKWKDGLIEHLPKYWGLLLVDPGGVTEFREALPNPKQKSRNILLEMWSGEFRAFLRKHQLTKQVSRTTKQKAASLAKVVPPAVTAAEFVQAVIARGGNYRVAAFRDYSVYVKRKSNYGK